MKTVTNHPKSLCKRDGKDASSACHWRNGKASESAMTPPGPSPTGITGARAGTVSNRLADFAGYGCQGPPCCQLRSKGFRFSRAVATAGQVPVCLSASSVRPVLGSWLPPARWRPLQSPHPIQPQREPRDPGQITPPKLKHFHRKDPFTSDSLLEYRA